MQWWTTALAGVDRANMTCQYNSAEGRELRPGQYQGALQSEALYWRRLSLSREGLQQRNELVLSSALEVRNPRAEQLTHLQIA